MSPTYQPSSLRDLRTHSNTGIVLDDHGGGRGGGGGEVSDARYLRQIKKTINVSLPLAFAGGGWMYGTELIGAIEAWMSCETGSAGGKAIRNRDTNSKQSLCPQQTCLEMLSKLCNGSSPIPKTIKQPVCRTWLMLLPLVVHQLGLDFASRFQVVGEVSPAWVLKGWNRD